MNVLEELIDLILNVGVVESLSKEIESATNHLYELAQGDEVNAVKEFAKQNKIKLGELQNE